MEGFKVPNGRDSLVFYVFAVFFALGYGTLLITMFNR